MDNQGKDYLEEIVGHNNKGKEHSQQEMAAFLKSHNPSTFRLGFFYAMPFAITQKDLYIEVDNRKVNTDELKKTIKDNIKGQYGLFAYLLISFHSGFVEAYRITAKQEELNSVYFQYIGTRLFNKGI